MDVSPDDTLDPAALIDEPATAPEVSAEERGAEEAAARRLAERYRLDFVQPVDMFPQTAEIEIAAKFQIL